MDARGRLIMTDSQKYKVFRFDPADGTRVTSAGVGSSHFAGVTVDAGLSEPSFPAFDGSGNLYFADVGHRQIKTIAAGEL